MGTFKGAQSRRLLSLLSCLLFVTLVIGAPQNHSRSILVLSSKDAGSTVSTNQIVLKGVPNSSPYIQLTAAAAAAAAADGPPGGGAAGSATARGNGVFTELSTLPMEAFAASAKTLESSTATIFATTSSGESLVSNIRVLAATYTAPTQTLVLDIHPQDALMNKLPANPVAVDAADTYIYTFEATNTSTAVVDAAAPTAEALPVVSAQESSSQMRDSTLVQVVVGHSVKNAKLTSGQVATAAAEPAAGEPVPASVQYRLVVDTATDTSPQQTVTWITNSAKPQVSGCANYTMMVQKLTELMKLKSGPIEALVFLRQGPAAALMTPVNILNVQQTTPSTLTYSLEPVTNHETEFKHLQNALKRLTSGRLRSATSTTAGMAAAIAAGSDAFLRIVASFERNLSDVEGLTCASNNLAAALSTRCGKLEFPDPQNPDGCLSCLDGYQYGTMRFPGCPVTTESCQATWPQGQTYSTEPPFECHLPSNAISSFNKYGPAKSYSPRCLEHTFGAPASYETTACLNSPNGFYRVCLKDTAEVVIENLKATTTPDKEKWNSFYDNRVSPLKHVTDPNNWPFPGGRFFCNWYAFGDWYPVNGEGQKVYCDNREFRRVVNGQNEDPCASWRSKPYSALKGSDAIAAPKFNAGDKLRLCMTETGVPYAEVITKMCIPFGQGNDPNVPDYVPNCWPQHGDKPEREWQTFWKPLEFEGDTNGPYTMFLLDSGVLRVVDADNKEVWHN